VIFLLDTSVISETRRKKPDANVLAWYSRVAPAALYISVLSLGEIAKGVAKTQRTDAVSGRMLHAWLDGIRDQFANRIISIDAEIAEAWGRLAGVRPLPVIDGLLAATALVREMTLVTRNLRDIVDAGVECINPWER
jgi:predicted nucleic acid-binding protein